LKIFDFITGGVRMIPYLPQKLAGCEYYNSSFQGLKSFCFYKLLILQIFLKGEGKNFLLVPVLLVNKPKLAQGV